MEVPNFSSRSHGYKGGGLYTFTLRQCTRSHIYTVIPLEPLYPPTVRDIDSGILVATVAYAERDNADVMG